MQASPFDEMAAGYDEQFTHTACAAALREIVWARLRALFASHEHLLELGCGTGEDAIRLARAGHRVFATDVSEEMIRVARLKARAAGVADRVEFQVLPMEALHTLPRERGFDGVFSNFGAVNCVADLPRLGAAVAARLRPGAPLLFVVMGRHVPWEWAWFLARGDRQRAFRRLQAGGASWCGLRIHYPTPSELARSLAPHFRAQRRAGLGFVLPPSYAAGWLDRSPRTLAFLRGVERATSRVSAALSDHYLLEATCLGAEPR
jgi:SAM-dependent methyltransferase